MTAQTADTALNEKIEARAHQIWEETGRPEGKDLDHWKQAEQEIMAEQARDAPTKVIPEKEKPVI